MKNFTLNQFGTPGKCPAHNRPWTDDEQNQLIDLYPTTTCEEISRLLNRGIPAIRFRISQLREAGILPVVKKESFHAAGRRFHSAQLPHHDGENDRFAFAWPFRAEHLPPGTATGRQPCKMR